WQPWDGDDGQSAAQINPKIAHSLYEMTASNLDEFTQNRPGEADVDPGQLSDGDHVRMMMFLSSNDDTAQAMSASVQQHQQQIVADLADSDLSDANGAADRIAQLQSKYDVGAYNSARESGLNDVEAEKKRILLIKTGLGLLPVAPDASGTTGVAANAILSNAIEEPNLDQGEIDKNVDLPSGWGEDKG